MGCRYQVNGVLKVKEGQTKACLEYLYAQSWPFGEGDALITVGKDIEVNIYAHCSYSTAEQVDEDLQEAARRYGEGCSLFETNCDDEIAQLVVGASEDDRRMRLLEWIDNEIGKLQHRRARVLDGSEVV